MQPIRPLLALLALWTPWAALAVEGGAPSGPAYRSHGSDRVLMWDQSSPDLALRPDGTGQGVSQNTFLEHRLRVGGSWDLRGWTLDWELDALSGLLTAPDGGLVPVAGGDAWSAHPLETMAPERSRATAFSADGVGLRRLSLSRRTSAGVFGVGLNTFGWGQGLLANDGASKGPDGRVDLTRDFADQRFGDRVLRVSYGTKPLKLLTTHAWADRWTVGLAADLIVNDETARLLRPMSEWSDRGLLRDTGGQGVLIVKYAHDGMNGGLFATRRHISFAADESPDLQTTPFTPTMDVWVLDLTMDKQWTWDSVGAEASVALEGALVRGSTTAVRNASCTGHRVGGGGVDDACHVTQEGAVARGGLRWSQAGIDLTAGYASGDANPFDAHLTGFRFDRDFKAGMVLFDQVLAWQSALGVARAGDPDLSAQPAAGLELTSTNGAITNAWFAAPVGRWDPSPHLTVRLGGLWARAAAPLTDPLWTNRRSSLSNAFGRPAGQGYGTEVDGSVEYRTNLTPDIQLLAGVQAGVLFPGDAFEVRAGEVLTPFHVVKGRLGLTF